MKINRLVTTPLVCLAGFIVMAQQDAPKAAPARKKLLCIGEMKGWQQDAASHAFATIERLGRQTGIWDTCIRTDCQFLTKKNLTKNGKNLNTFDAVLFFTSGELNMDDSQKADLLSFVKEDGKGFIATQGAVDTFYKWPEYGEMVGGYFNQHPWKEFQAPLVVEVPSFPGMDQFPKGMTLLDELCQVKEPYSRDRVRVLMRLDAGKLDLKNPKVHRADGDFPVAWARTYGKGRVFYSCLGYREDVWDRPDVQHMWTEAIKWAMGLIPGDATPRPKPE
jgi:type 1 glutamine amidotransferase